MVLTNRFLEVTVKTYQFCEMDFLGVRPRAICKDNFNISIQAGRGYNSQPNNDFGPYTHVELGYPIHPSKFLMFLMETFGIPVVEVSIVEHAEDGKHLTQTIYKNVPVEKVDELIKKHGGIVGWEVNEGSYLRTHRWREKDK